MASAEWDSDSSSPWLWWCRPWALVLPDGTVPTGTSTAPRVTHPSTALAVRALGAGLQCAPTRQNLNTSMLNPFLLWSCSSLEFGYLLICPCTGQCASCAWILSSILVSLLAFDKVLLCSPCTDVWQLRRGCWWWPGQHVSCAPHHPSTVFPFTPEANGPKLQETSHCCFSQSVTQASSKLKNVLPLYFFFLFILFVFSSLPPPPFFFLPSVFSDCCFGVKSMEFCLFGAKQVED